MKLLSKSLQNPFIKILLSPLATILFGLIIGINESGSVQWLSLILLIIIAIFSQLLNHLFFLRYDKITPEAAPQFLMVFFEVVLLISSIVFMFNSHWIINLLLIFYLVFIHIQYFPFKMTASLYHILLYIFFNAYVLNIIAYNSQTFTVTTDVLLALIPILLQFLALILQELELRQYLSPYIERFNLPSHQVIVLSLSVLALVSALFFSFPSNSYFMVQILFFLISGFFILPLLVETRDNLKAQNKINYTHAITLIFTLLYSLSYIY